MQYNKQTIIDRREQKKERTNERTKERKKTFEHFNLPFFFVNFVLISVIFFYMMYICITEQTSIYM